MYNALVLPHFNYCSTMWNDGCYSTINKLFKLQKRAARVIIGDTYDVHSTQTLHSLNWFPSEELVDHLDILKICFLSQLQLQFKKQVRNQTKL